MDLKIPPKKEKEQEVETASPASQVLINLEQYVEAYYKIDEIATEVHAEKNEARVAEDLDELEPLTQESKLTLLAIALKDIRGASANKGGNGKGNRGPWKPTQKQKKFLYAKMKSAGMDNEAIKEAQKEAYKSKSNFDEAVQQLKEAGY